MLSKKKYSCRSSRPLGTVSRAWFTAGVSLQKFFCKKNYRSLLKLPGKACNVTALPHNGEQNVSIVEGGKKRLSKAACRASAAFHLSVYKYKLKALEAMMADHITTTEHLRGIERCVTPQLYRSKYRLPSLQFDRKE